MRSLIAVLAVLVVACSVVSTKLWRGLRAERELAASLQTQLDAAGQAPLIEEAVPSAGVPAPAAAPATVTATASANQPAAVVARSAPNLPDVLRNFEQQQREMMKDPDYRKARFAQLRTSIAANNKSLAEDLGISQAEADKVLDLLVEHDLAMSNDLGLMIEPSDQSAMQEVIRKQQEAIRKRDESVAALLGPSRAVQWQQYQQAAPARARVNSINSTLARGGQPLSAAQQKSLATALNTEMRIFNDEMTALTRGVNTQDPAVRARLEPLMLNRQEELNQQILVAAAPVLNAAQLSLMRAQVEQQNAMTKAMARARERAATTQSQGAP